MASRKGKAGTRRVPPALRNANDNTEEVDILEEIDGDFVSKDAYIAMKKALDDLKKKVLSSNKEKKRLQDKIQSLTQENSFLKEQEQFRSTIEKENEALKEKLELGFQAFDEKYKESENLKQKLKTIKKEDENKQTEDTSEEHQDAVVQKEETATQTKTNFNLVGERTTTSADSFTQTPEEKTDEVFCVSPPSQRQLLKCCGLEIVSEKGKDFLILANRDALIQWLENETEGKVTVAFERTPVFERFVQTDEHFSDDEMKLQEQVHSEECQENKNMVIQLKNKIVDQANIIKKYRLIIDLVKKSEQKTVTTSSVMVQTQGTVANERIINKRVQLFTRYRGLILKSMFEVKQKMLQLNEELEFQKGYSNRLLATISGAKGLPENFISSILSATRGKFSKAREIRKPPASTAVLEEEIYMDSSKINSPPDSYDSLNNPPLSMPVQETDRRLRVKISKPKDLDYDPTLDEGASGSADPVDSHSLSSESSASIVSVQFSSEDVKNKHSLVPHNIPPTTREVTSTQTSISRVEQASGSGHDDGDDIEVIDEEEGAAGEGSGAGAKECPLCFLLYTPSTSQQQYENHVMGHFQETDG